MIVPTIHPNGTSRERLISQLTAVTGHLEAARKALKNAAPNARDYYPQGPGAIERAGYEHGLRLQTLDALAADLESLILAIDEAGK